MKIIKDFKDKIDLAAKIGVEVLYRLNTLVGSSVRTFSYNGYEPMKLSFDGTSAEVTMNSLEIIWPNVPLIPDTDFDKSVVENILKIAEVFNINLFNIKQPVVFANDFSNSAFECLTFNKNRCILFIFFGKSGRHRIAVSKNHIYYEVVFDKNSIICEGNIRFYFENIVIFNVIKTAFWPKFHIRNSEQFGGDCSISRWLESNYFSVFVDIDNIVDIVDTADVINIDIGNNIFINKLYISPADSSNFITKESGFPHNKLLNFNTKNNVDFSFINIFEEHGIGRIIQKVRSYRNNIGTGFIHPFHVLMSFIFESKIKDEYFKYFKDVNMKNTGNIFKKLFSYYKIKNGIRTEKKYKNFNVLISADALPKCKFCDINLFDCAVLYIKKENIFSIEKAIQNYDKSGRGKDNTKFIKNIWPKFELEKSMVTSAACTNCYYYGGFSHPDTRDDLHLIAFFQSDLLSTIRNKLIKSDKDDIINGVFYEHIKFLYDIFTKDMRSFRPIVQQKNKKNRAEEKDEGSIKYSSQWFSEYIFTNSLQESYYIKSELFPGANYIIINHSENNIREDHDCICSDVLLEKSDRLIPAGINYYIHFRDN